jgi:hypothetical protein
MQIILDTDKYSEACPLCEQWILPGESMTIIGELDEAGANILTVYHKECYDNSEAVEERIL